MAYVSRSLTSVEQKYSQTEKEALAIVWAIERLHIYLYGGHFTLVTDCKPLQWIFKNPKSKPPARIERWSLRLQEYSFSVKHIQGSENPSDYLSRHPVRKQLKYWRKQQSNTSISLVVIQYLKLCHWQRSKKLQ